MGEVRRGGIKELFFVGGKVERLALCGGFGEVRAGGEEDDGGFLGAFGREAGEGGCHGGDELSDRGCSLGGGELVVVQAQSCDLNLVADW